MPSDYQFGPFRLDAERRALYRGEEFVPLTRKAADVLLLLVEEAGRIVTKEQLLERVWPGVIVEEGTIANNISALRKALGDGEFGPDGPIANVPRRGYRFTATVTSGSVPEARPESRPVPDSLITERDTILVADFENRTGDPVFDGTIRQALLFHLAQSPYLEIATDRRVLTVLGYMGKRGAPLLGEVALEASSRLGTKAVITGTIFSFADEYMIGLQALHGDTGAILVTEQARAKGKAEVLKALDTAASDLRTKLGESLPSVEHYSRPFGEMATSSLEALNAYTVGRAQWFAVSESAGKPHYLRAVALDPEFASAYQALSHLCYNMGQSQEAIGNMKKAYALADRVSERERVRIMAGYHDVVTGNFLAALDHYRMWETTYPRDAVAPLNCSNLLMQLGQWEKALASVQRSHAMEPNNITSNNLANCLLALGRHEEARAILEDAIARGLDTFYLHLDAYQEGFLRGDESTMKRHASAVSGRGSEDDYLLAAQADTEAYYGRFKRARELTSRAVDSARNSDGVEMAAMWQAEAALREAEIGELALARKGATAALETFHGRDTSCLAGFVFARAGASKEAKELVAELEKEYPQNTSVQRYWLPCIRAAIALSEKNAVGAIECLGHDDVIELAITLPFEHGFMIAPYLRGLAMLEASRPGEAVAEFTKIIERPGLIKNFVLFPLAHLQASKALKAAGRKDEATAMRRKFDDLWKSADVEAP
jgi:DNA-binding winged helix-turn-helix (wHTH) protein/tetratricopeptide (TPR) repeat protein